MATPAGRDFDTELKGLIDYLRLNHPDKVNSLDFEGDLGRILLRLHAHNSAGLGYLIDAKSLEAFPQLAQLRESLIHHANSRGYRIRGATSATIQALCRSSVVPVSPTYFHIRGGTRIRSSNGIPWEISQDYYIQPGQSFPISTLLSYGDIVANVIRDNSSVSVEAVVHLAIGSNVVTLCDELGNRLPSSVNFGSLVGPGHIRKLTSKLVGGIFGAAPDITRDEYAIVGVEKLTGDQFEHSVLYLDRPWSGDIPYYGKWVIEDRSITLRQGQTYQESFTGPTDSIDRQGYSQQVSFYPVIWDGVEPYVPSGPLYSALGDTYVGNSSVQVTVNGFQWQESPALSLEASTSQVYEIRFDEMDRMTVVFGDGRSGAILPADAIIGIKYRVGGGKDGNIPQGSFDTNIMVYGPDGASHGAYLSNPYTTGSGGRDRETLDEVRRNIVAFTRSNDRAVTPEDWDVLANGFSDPESGRVSLARAVLRTNLVPREQNLVYVHTWARGPTGQMEAPSQSLKQKLHRYLTSRKMFGDEVIIVNGQTETVPLHIQYRYEAGLDPLSLEEDVRSAVDRVFGKLRPGDSLRLSDLYEEIGAISGIGFCNVISPSDHVSPSSDFALLSNSIQVAVPAKLSARVSIRDTSVVVDNPSAFTASGAVSIFEHGRLSTSSTVLSIAGSTLTLATPVSDSYSAGSFCIPSDWFVYGWCLERRVQVYVRYDASAGGVDAISRAIRERLHTFFSKQLLPQQAITRTGLKDLVDGVSGVSLSSVNINSSDSTVETVSAIPKERLVLGRLYINGVSA